MKRQKRDCIGRALSRGYQAGMSGKSRESCPHDTGEVRHMWISGWREGREDHWNGFNTMTQVQRLNSMR